MVPILLSRPPSPEETAHRVRISLAPGVPAQFHKAFTERTRIRMIDGWGSTETNFVLGTTGDRQQPARLADGRAFEHRMRQIDGDFAGFLRAGGAAQQRRERDQRAPPHQIDRKSSPISAAGADWVSRPTEI